MTGFTLQDEGPGMGPIFPWTYGLCATTQHAADAQDWCSAIPRTRSTSTTGFPDFQLDNEDLGWFGRLLELAQLRAADAWYRWISEHMSDICRVEFSISTNIYTQIHQTFVQEVPRDFHRLSPGGGRSEAGRTWILFGCFTWGYICVGFFRALQCGEWNSDCYKLYNHTPLSTVWNAQQTMAIPNLNLMLWCFRATILSFMLLHYVLSMCMVCPINK